MCLLCGDVGPVHPTEFKRNRQWPRPEVGPTVAGGLVAAGVPPAKEAERVLRRVERNFTSLTRTVPMEEIEDLPSSMQPHVWGHHGRGSNFLGVWKTPLIIIAGPIGPILS
jgi:hypothetical protein